VSTPRKRWFRVADSLLREPWDRDTKATLVLLAAHLSSRWASEGLSAAEGCRAVLSRHALAEITGRVRLDKARRSIARLAHHTGIEVSLEGDNTTIFWPKFSEFQGWTTLDRGRYDPSERPSSPAPAPAPAPKRREEVRRAPTELEPEASKVAEKPPREVPTGAEAAAASSASVRRLANLLAKEPGEAAAKIAFCEEAEPIIVAEAEAAHPRDRLARSAKVRSLTLRFYRAQLRRENPSDPWDDFAAGMRSIP